MGARPEAASAAAPSEAAPAAVITSMSAPNGPKSGLKSGENGSPPRDAGLVTLAVAEARTAAIVAVAVAGSIPLPGTAAPVAVKFIDAVAEADVPVAEATHGPKPDGAVPTHDEDANDASSSSPLWKTSPAG